MCDDKSADFFHCPAYKLLISDIRCAVPKTPQSFENDVDDEEKEIEWYLTINQLCTKNGDLILKSANPSKPSLVLHLKLVWMQGTIIRIDDDGEIRSLVIRDEDGEKEDEAIIYDYDSVPGGNHDDIKIGSYVGTLGQIWSVDPVVTVKAAKMMHLSDKPICKAMWKDEVTLAKAFLAGLILPST